MIDWLLENWSSLIMGGAIVALWSIAHDRRTAVDRYTKHLHKKRKPDDLMVCRKVIGAIDGAGWLPGWSLLGGPSKQDAAGRVIARSVKRVTKEKP